MRTTHQVARNGFLADPTGTVSVGESGDCPPQASDLDESDLSTGGEQPDQTTAGEGENQDWMPKWQAMISRRLRSMQKNAEDVLEYIRSADEYDPEVVLQYVNTIRSILDDIARVADGESLDGGLSRILDEGDSDETRRRVPGPHARGPRQVKSHARTTSACPCQPTFREHRARAARKPGHERARRSR